MGEIIELRTDFFKLIDYAKKAIDEGDYVVASINLNEAMEKADSDKERHLVNSMFFECFRRVENGGAMVEILARDLAVSSKESFEKIPVKMQKKYNDYYEEEAPLYDEYLEYCRVQNLIRERNYRAAAAALAKLRPNLDLMEDVCAALDEASRSDNAFDLDEFGVFMMNVIINAPFRADFLYTMLKSGRNTRRVALEGVTLLLDDEGNELLLPKTEQIPSDFYRKGETARAVVARVDNKNNNPKIILSRTSPVFLQRLFEMEVPEINDGLITIRKIARIPGERAKIAVESYDDRIDPVGACVGVKGSRIHGIVRELRNENIDVINYTSNIQLFIQRALSPAKISSIRLNEEEHKAEVFLKPEEVSLAIGKGGLNIKLASMLTEYTIDVFREVDGTTLEDEDIYLDEFRDEIEGWVIDAIKGIGIDTAKAVLNAPREMLIEKADLEEETVDEVLRILKQEFEKE